MKFFLVAIFLLILSLSGCSLGYVARAGWEESKILWRRKPITELITKSETPEDLKRKFELVLEARDYAAELGLEPKGSFSSFSQVDDSAVTWVVTAAPQFKLEPKTWWFPIVGSIPYKGYFNANDAKRYAEELKKEGFDVHVRGSTAFSTLGWFDDPLLSTTAKLDDVQLVETVLHELLHNTVWIPGDVAFNETLANVVGSYGALKFFAKKDGVHGARTIRAQQQLTYELEYSCRLAELYQSLTKLYEDKETTAEKKTEAIRGWIATLPPQLANLREKLEKDPEQLNNATIIGEVIYRWKISRFVDQLSFFDYDISRLVVEAKVDRRKFLEKLASPEYRYLTPNPVCKD